MKLSDLLVKINNYNKLTLIVLFILFVSILSIPIIFVLGFLITIDIILWINLMILLAILTSCILVGIHIKLNKLNIQMKKAKCIVTNTIDSPIMVKLGNTYKFSNYSPKSNSYETNEIGYIHEAFIKEIKEDTLVLWPKCELEKGLEVEIQNVLSNGFTLVKTNRHELCILDASSVSLVNN